MSDTANTPHREITIRSYVGGHDTVIYEGAEYDPATRKYFGGHPVAVIPYSGRMLSAYQEPPQKLPPLYWNSVAIPLYSEPQWTAVDPIPEAEECDYAIVSTMYVAACRSLGLDTSRLLTVGGAVADAEGHTIGAAWLNKN